MSKTSRRRKDDTWFLSAFHKGEYVTIETFKRRPRSPPDASTVPFQNDGDQEDSPVCKKEKVKTVALVLPHERTGVIVLQDEEPEIRQLVADAACSACITDAVDIVADAAYFCGITDASGCVPETPPQNAQSGQNAHQTNYSPIEYILEDISQDTVQPSHLQTTPPPQCHEEVATVCQPPQPLGMGISGLRGFCSRGK